MKETKVYADELPEYCDDCPCSLRDKDDCAYCNLLHKNIGYDFGKRPKHCPLQSLKTHDRELVKEVCEKIRSELEKELKYDFTSYVPIMNVCNKINRVLDQTQKEYEK